MNTVEWISIAASIASLVLAGLAIWLALYHKKETDRTSDKVRELLLEVKSDAKVVTTFALPELKKYSDAMVDHVFYGKNRDIKADLSRPALTPSGPRTSETADTANADAMSEFRTVVSSIHSGEGFTNKERDQAIRLVRQIKNAEMDNDPEFSVLLEQLLDSLAAADQNRYADMLDDLFEDITTSEPGINQTMLNSLGLRILETDDVAATMIDRFEKHMAKVEELDTIEYALPPLMVFHHAAGESKKVDELIERMEGLDPIKIASIQESLERRCDADHIARKPTARIRAVATKYKRFMEQYGQRISGMA